MVYKNTFEIIVIHIVILMDNACKFSAVQHTKVI